ncbi:DNA/RNA non-specific endonuclease [Nocardiopsis chromatogenes]|uniref:DNA/RNA non-specific endonuclease n=1 Tax=Nocardiopsis chromatogenes TaxID=280239 RepID=UPI000348EA55|nr:DNA/RNA non-specific endonuclease [Nocardiopsis chromatogenes]
MEAPPTSGTSGSGTTTMQHLDLDPATLIVPEAIPIPGTAPEALADAASGTSSSGAGIESAGQDIRSVWQALAGVYTAPESDQLLRAANPIADLGGEIGGTMAAAAGALQKFSEEADRLKGQLLELRGTAQEFVDGLDDDWNNDSDTVDENVNLKVQANRLVTSFQEAERECANAITSLFGGTTFVPVGSNPHNEEGIIEYGVTMDADVNQVPEYSTFLVSDTGRFLEGFSRGWWETAGPGMAKTLGMTFLASTGYYHPENGWTMDHWEALGNRGEFYTNFAVEAGTKAGNSLGIGFEEGTLIPSRWGLDIMATHYRDQAHEFFPWTELDDDPGHAFGVGAGNTAMAVAGAVSGRALSAGRLASAASNVKTPATQGGHLLGEQLQGRGPSQLSPLRGGTTPHTWGGQMQGENGSTSSSGSGPGNGQQPDSENLNTAVNALDNKIGDSQPQNPQPQGEPADTPKHERTGAPDSTPDSTGDRDTAPGKTADADQDTQADASKSEGQASGQKHQDQERAGTDQRAGASESQGADTRDTVAAWEAERFVRLSEEDGVKGAFRQYDDEKTVFSERDPVPPDQEKQRQEQVAVAANGDELPGNPHSRPSSPGDIYVDDASGGRVEGPANGGGRLGDSSSPGNSGDERGDPFNTGGARGQFAYNGGTGGSDDGGDVWNSGEHDLGARGHEGISSDAESGGGRGGQIESPEELAHRIDRLISGEVSDEMKFNDPELDAWDSGRNNPFGKIELPSPHPEASSWLSSHLDEVVGGRETPRIDERVTVSKDTGSALVPKAREPFGRGVTLDPNTAYEVTDKRGLDRGTFITNENGKVVEVRSTSGKKGGWSPDLKSPLPEVKYVIDEKYVYHTDSEGRRIYGTAKDGLVERKNDRGPEQRLIGKEGEWEYEELNKKILEDFKTQYDRLPQKGEANLYDVGRWNGGHLIATEWDGGGDRINKVPMREELNKVLGGSATVDNNYRKLEISWEDIVRKYPNAKIVPHIFGEYIEKDFLDPNRKVVAPDRIYVLYTVEINGVKRVGGPLVYNNVPPRGK